MQFKELCERLNRTEYLGMQVIESFLETPGGASFGGPANRFSFGTKTHDPELNLAAYEHHINSFQINIEDVIILRTIVALLDAGYMLTVGDREGVFIADSTSKASVFEHIQSVDEAVVTVRKGKDQPYEGFVLFVLGEGHTVICDYTDGLSHILDVVVDYAETL